MLKTLRARLIASHILLLLIIIPMVGLAMVYLLETRVLIPRLEAEHIGQARLLAILAALDQDMWDDPDEAERFANNLDDVVVADLALISTDGQMLASSRPSQQPPDISALINGDANILVTTNQDLQSEVVDILIPVIDNGQIAGVLRLTQHVEGVIDLFVQLRTVVVLALAGGLIVGGLLGLLLAINIERPIQNLTQAMNVVAAGNYHDINIPDYSSVELAMQAHAFNTMNQRLDAFEQSRKQMLASLVHELGRPLGAMLAANEALQKGAVEDITLRNDLLSGTTSEIRRLRNVLNELAALYDVSYSNMDMAQVNLLDWLPDMLVSWREAAKAKGITWQVFLPNQPAIVYADADQLAKMIGNLVSNAVKYTPQGGSITIELSQENDRITFKVNNDGVKIKDEDRLHIFEPFYRAQADRRFPQGMGIGLTIARDTAQLHGGSLTLLPYSEDPGNTFLLNLPVSP